MYQALYRSFRPEVFEEVLGQEHIVKILKNQIKNDKISHAYLFSGTRGTGKTTLARILAKGINCESTNGEKPCGVCASCINIKQGTHMDVVEIDAASNNGVDNVRELNESIAYPPISGRYKVYIIDEVHMLSNSAFNALLKTLEEPPEYVVFVMATTEPERLPKTILSRCLHLDFRRVPEDVIIQGMKKICADLGAEVSNEALKIVAKNADGSVRDGLSILDQCLASGEKVVEREDVLETLGAAGEEAYIDLTDAVIDGNAGEVLIKINHLINLGKDEKQMFKDWIGHYRNLMMASYLNKPEDMMTLSIENIERLKKQANRMTVSDINRGIVTLSKVSMEAKWSTQARILLEVAAVMLASGETETENVKVKQAAQPINVQIKPPKKKPKLPEAGQVNGDAEQPQKNVEQVQKNAEQVQKEVGQNRGEKNISDSESKRDLKELWNNVLQRGRERMMMIQIMVTGAYIVSEEREEVKIFVKSDPAKRAILLNENVLVEVLEELTGVKRKITCVYTDEAPKQPKEDKVLDRAKKIEDALGINVEIE